MHDALELVRGEELREGIAIGEIGLLELESRILSENREPRVLQRDVVVLIEVVEAHHFVAALE
jgi:hypothetical protein